MIMLPSLFTDNSFRIVLRLHIPRWNESAVMEDTLRYCRENHIRNILLFSDAQYIVWNQLTPEEIKRDFPVWKRCVETFHRNGFESVGMNCSLMQPQSKADHRQHMNYDYWLTNADGRCDHNLPCPMDPKLKEYIRLFFGSLAATGADYLFMDDDLRIMNNMTANSLGCHCPLHLRKFGELTGRSWEREELRKAILKDPVIRRKWLDFNGGCLEELAERISESAHAVNPEIHTGLMLTCVNAFPLSGHDLQRTVRKICHGNRPLLRPCIGPYNDNERKYVFAGLYHMEMTRRIFGEGPDYCPEIETSPSTAVSKSATVARFYMIQGILNRMNNPLFTTVGYCGDTPYLEPRYPHMLKESQTYFEVLQKHAPLPECRKGIGLCSNLQAVRSYDRPVNNIDKLYLPAIVLHDILDTCGLPHTYENSSVTFVCGLHAAGFTREQARELLKKGVFLDAEAAEIFIGMGLGELIGVSSVENQPFVGSERCDLPEIFGAYAGTFMQSRIARANALMKLQPLPGAQAVSTFMDYDVNPLYPAVLRFENSLGGRIVVLPYVIEETLNDNGIYHLICHQRQKMFQSLVDWMDPELIPCRFPDGSDIVIQYWQETRRIVLTFTNITYDVYNSQILTTSLPLNQARCLDDNGTIRPLQYADGILHERLEPFRPLVIFLENLSHGTK